jgi:lipoate-protein ligase A
MQTSTWRLMCTSPANGAWNMALDEAILLSIGRGESPATLRLFAWDPPCLSLGYAQPFADIDIGAITARGWGVVRRPTGGRAILHTDEITYSVIASNQEPRLAGSIVESYRRLSRALLEVLRLLGIQSNADKEYDLPEQVDKRGAVCFEVPSNYEITVGDKKILGSAQARRSEGILQHGSLPLFGDISRITQVLTFPDESKRNQVAQRVLERAVTIESILQKSISWEEAAIAFEKAFESTLDLQFVHGDPTPQELQEAERLVREKYANSAWTKRI